jgi:hypothetical protein
MTPGTAKKHEVKHATAAQRATINELIHLRDVELKANDTAFHAEYFADVCSYTVWFRLQKDNYTGNTAAICEALADKLVFLKERLRTAKVAERTEANDVFFKTDSVLAALSAVDEALDRGDEIRLVVYLAKFGQGKSALGRYLKRTKNALIVPVFNTWRSSYSAGLKGLRALLGVTGKYRTIEELRERVFHEVRCNPRILFFDDANTLGPESLNLIRDLLNHTPCTVVVAAIPELMDQLYKKSFWEAGQMFSRSVAVIPAEDVKTDDVAHFMKPFKLNGASSEAFKAIKAAANEFGHFRFVKRIVEYCDKQGGREKGLTLEQVLHGVRLTQAFLRTIQAALQRQKRRAAA